VGKSYSFIANSSIMALLCGGAIVFAMVQSVLFFRLAYKQAKEVGLTKSDIKKVVKGSAIFSIIPSLPILISYMILLPALGKFFPWLRLSVIGSAAYETMAANMAVTGFGYDGLGGANLSPNIYGSIMWVVTLGVMVSSLTVLILRRYDNKMQEVTANKSSFGALVGPIMLLSLMAAFSTPYLTDFSNPVAIITIIVSAGSMVLIDKLSKKYATLKEFAFALSMVLGMVSASIATSIIGG